MRTLPLKEGEHQAEKAFNQCNPYAARSHFDGCRLTGRVTRLTYGAELRKGWATFA